MTQQVCSRSSLPPPIRFYICFYFRLADAPVAEAVKRKVDEAAAKADEAVATPEKKAKLDEASTKDEVQNGAEASEVAA